MLLLNMFDISLLSQKKSSHSDIMPKPIALTNCNTVYTTGSSDHIFYLNILFFKTGAPKARGHFEIK